LKEKKAIKQVLSSPLCLFLPLPIEIGVITRLLIAPKLYKKIAGSITEPFRKIRGKKRLLAHFRRAEPSFSARLGKRSRFASSIGESDEGLLRRRKGSLFS